MHCVPVLLNSQQLMINFQNKLISKFSSFLRKTNAAGCFSCNVLDPQLRRFWFYCLCEGNLYQYLQENAVQQLD